jgi:hypothetical protein
MSSAPNANPAPTEPREVSVLAGILSYVIPGLGQIYQGRYGKGFLFMVSLLGMFFLGQAMGQWQNVYLPRGERDNRGIANAVMARWHFAGQFWVGAAAWPAVCQFYDKWPLDKEAHPFLYFYQKAPDEGDLNRFLINSDKTPDLGWVYTVIAGMLNILVIYDAFAGPAFLPQARPANKEPAATQPVAATGGAL